MGLARQMTPLGLLVLPPFIFLACAFVRSLKTVCLICTGAWLSCDFVIEGNISCKTNMHWCKSLMFTGYWNILTYASKKISDLVCFSRCPLSLSSFVQFESHGRYNISVESFGYSSICSNDETLSKILEGCMLKVVNLGMVSGRVINKPRLVGHQHENKLSMFLCKQLLYNSG